MKVLVTGGGGFLGLYIIKGLIHAGHTVVNLSRNHYTELDPLGVETLICDLSEFSEVSNLDLLGFDAVIHTAAKAGVWGDKKEYFSINFDGTKNLFDRACEFNIKYFVYTSSPSVVFGDNDIFCGDETITYPKRFYTHYAKSKAKGEKYIIDGSLKNSTIQVVSLRPHLIWGPGDPHLIPRVIEKAKKNRLKQVGNGENLVDIIYVKNAAMAHIQVLGKMTKDPSLTSKCYFIGQERPVKLWDFLNDILKLNKLEAIEQVISFKCAFYLGHLFELVFRFLGIIKPEPPMTRFIALQLAKSHYFSHDQAKKDFGYNPVYSIEEGLAETFKPLSQ